MIRTAIETRLRVIVFIDFLIKNKEILFNLWVCFNEFFEFVIEFGDFLKMDNFRIQLNF